MEIAALLIVLVLILILPFLVHKVEEELEIFLCLMGAVTVSLTGKWSIGLILKATGWHSMRIALAVLAAGFVFAYTKRYIGRGVGYVLARRSGRTFFFLLVLVLGLVSSLITAIVASLILVEIIGLLKLDRETETSLTVIACFSIGLGACLTPIGEPLSAIAVGNLSGPPLHAGFFFMVGLVGAPVLFGVFALSMWAGFLHGHKVRTHTLSIIGPRENARRITIRAIKIYIFMIGLFFLGAGYEVIINTYIVRMHHYALYFINVVSAVLDNATLAAAEVGPKLDIVKIKAILLSLLVSGGILIPGNIPNIIAANKLGIGSRAWARTGVPVGVVMLGIYFIWVLLGW